MKKSNGVGYVNCVTKRQAVESGEGDQTDKGHNRGRFDKDILEEILKCICVYTCL